MAHHDPPLSTESCPLSRQCRAREVRLKKLSVRAALVICSCCIALASARGAEEARYFISPGIKLGYTFGDPSGFTFGWEVSFFRTFTWHEDNKDEGFIGIALDIDWCKSITKVHVGFEGSHRLLGACLGPTLVVRDEERSMGLTTTVYSWFVALPYISVTYVWGAPHIVELGGYLKIPLQLNGKSYWNMRVGG